MPDGARLAAPLLVEPYSPGRVPALRADSPPLMARRPSDLSRWGPSHVLPRSSAALAAEVLFAFGCNFVGSQELRR